MIHFIRTVLVTCKILKKCDLHSNLTPQSLSVTPNEVAFQGCSHKFAVGRSLTFSSSKKECKGSNLNSCK